MVVTTKILKSTHSYFRIDISFVIVGDLYLYYMYKKVKIFKVTTSWMSLKSHVIMLNEKSFFLDLTTM